MTESKLIRVLKTFSKQEFKEFEIFIISPVFADGKIYTRLLKVLKKHYPEFNKITREEIYSTLYPGKRYKESVIFTILSGLYNLAKEFLSENEFRSNKNLKVLLLNRQFHKRGLSDIFQGSFEMFYDNLNKEPYDSENMRVLIEADKLALQHYSLLGKYDDLNESFEKHTHNFIISTVEHLSKLIHDLYVNQGAYNQNKDRITAFRFTSLIDFDKIPEIINNLKTVNIFTIYKDIINFCFNQDVKAYLELKKNIIEHLDNFSKNEQYELFIILSDFTNDLIAKDPDYIFELNKLYKEMMKKGIYLDTRYGFMQMALFRNMLASAIRNKEYKWAEDFTENYFSKLNPKIQENALNFSKAFIFFAKRDFTEALRLASMVKFEDFFYKKDIKQLTLQIYFELNYYEEFLSFCDSYKHFLKSSRKISPVIRKKHMDLITYSLILIEIKNNRKKYPVEKLFKEINDNKLVVSKGWLLQKIDEIKKN